MNHVFMNPKWPLLCCRWSFQAYVNRKCIIRLSNASLRVTRSEITTLIWQAGFVMIYCQRWEQGKFQNDSHFTHWPPFLKFQTKEIEGRWRGTYLFHVPVIHGVVRHFIRLQLDNLFELVAIAFPLADYDHFVKQEDVPSREGGLTRTQMSGIRYIVHCFFYVIKFLILECSTHRSCFVLLMMEQTFSSPSIFGLPYSSSLTCCLGHKGNTQCQSFAYYGL